MSLEIANLDVSIEGIGILRDVNLTIPPVDCQLGKK